MQIISDVNNYYNLIVKEAFIKKVKNKWRVVSRKGKNLGEYSTKEEAIKRLKQIEFFKHKKASTEDSLFKNKIDLFINNTKTDTTLTDICRKLNQLDPNSNIKNKFIELTTDYANNIFASNTYDDTTSYDIFDIIDHLPCILALQTIKDSKYPEKNNLKCDIEISYDKDISPLIKEFYNKYKNQVVVKSYLQPKLIKSAQIVNLGDPDYAGKYLSDIMKFVMQRISEENRPKSLLSLKNKILNFNEVELSEKKTPASAAIGQCITFLKHILINHNPQYIRAVLNSIAKYLI